MDLELALLEMVVKGDSPWHRVDALLNAATNCLLGAGDLDNGDPSRAAGVMGRGPKLLGTNTIG